MSVAIQDAKVTSPADMDKVEKLKNALEEMFGDRLANAEHFPRLYTYQLKLFVSELEMKKKDDGRTVPTTTS